MEKLNKLALIVSAIAISGALAAPAGAMYRTDLANIREFVESGDAIGLRNYIRQNPQVLDGSVLGQQLAEFIEQPPEVAVSMNDPVLSDIRGLVEDAKNDPSLY